MLSTDKLTNYITNATKKITSFAKEVTTRLSLPNAQSGSQNQVTYDPASDTLLH